jgi:hypothetical protein
MLYTFCKPLDLNYDVEEEKDKVSWIQAPIMTSPVGRWEDTILAACCPPYSSHFPRTTEVLSWGLDL